MQKKNFFLLLHAQDVGGVSLYKRNRYSSSFTISEWKESFIRKSLPTLILASEFTEEERIFFFFFNLRVEEGSAKDVIFSSSSTFFQETVRMPKLIWFSSSYSVIIDGKKKNYFSSFAELGWKESSIMFEKNNQISELHTRAP